MANTLTATPKPAASHGLYPQFTPGTTAVPGPGSGYLIATPK